MHSIIKHISCNVEDEQNTLRWAAILSDSLLLYSSSSLQIQDVAFGGLGLAIQGKETDSNFKVFTIITAKDRSIESVFFNPSQP